MDSKWQRVGRWLIVTVFAGSLWILYWDLAQYDLQDVSRQILEIPGWRLLAAVCLTVANYVVLIGYDVLALRAIQHPLSWPKTAFGSFTGFVSSYNLGPLLGGSAVRFRLYSSWGLSPSEILQVLGMLGITFSVGVMFLAGAVFVGLPGDELQFLPITAGYVRGLGVLLLGLTAGFVALAAWWRRPLRLMGTEVRLPPASITVAQILIAAVDFLITAGCLYVLVAHQVHLSYWQMLAIVLLAMVTAVVSHVPGGVGVFELVVLQFAGGQKTPELL
ncbi:MAG: lysylphosphatidylglycerol synthase domain-containing protein, partial [Thermoguttaceae bacterium]